MNTSIFKFFKMKSLIGSLSAFMLSFTAFGQIYSTGEVTLTTGFTVKIDVNTDTDKVTMTMVGPDNRWLGVAFANSTPTNPMGVDGDDAVLFYQLGGSNVLRDMHMEGTTSAPDNDDINQDWTYTADTDGGVRTIIATRDQNTGDADDYVFPDSASFPLMWAMGSGLNLGWHGGTNRAGTIVTLSAVNLEPLVFEVYPNPVQDRLQLLFGQALPKAEVVLHNNLGQEVMRHTVGGTEAELDTSYLAPGMYLLQLRSEGRQAVRTLVKE
jgi:hypothetical protein